MQQRNEGCISWPSVEGKDGTGLMQFDAVAVACFLVNENQ